MSELDRQRGELTSFVKSAIGAELKKEVGSQYEVTDSIDSLLTDRASNIVQNFEEGVVSQRISSLIQEHRTPFWVAVLQSALGGIAVLILLWLAALAIAGTAINPFEILTPKE